MQDTWISVDERVPDDEESVLIVTKAKNGAMNVDKGYYTKDKFGDKWVRRGSAEVRWWMPIPALPEIEI